MHPSARYHKGLRQTIDTVIRFSWRSIGFVMYRFAWESRQKFILCLFVCSVALLESALLDFVLSSLSDSGPVGASAPTGRPRY